MRVVAAGRTVVLGPDTFVAQGGEASVYAVDDVAYKVFTDPSRVPPPERLAVLRPLAGPDVVAPQHDLHDEQGKRVGFTLPYLKDWSPWVRMQSTAYQTRNGLVPGDLFALATGLADTVARVHAAGAVIVDLSDLNVLYDPTHRRSALIDVDSWAIGRWSATAIADAIRDRHAADPTADSDWFSFAVLAFQLFVGLHPYRGRHPTVRTLDDRMSGNLSVFRPDVTLPPIVDLGRIPPGWRDWFQAVFDDGHRSAPPRAFGAPVSLRPQRTFGVRRTVVQTISGPVDDAFAIDSVLYVRSAGGLWADGRRTGPARAGVPLRRPAGPPAMLTLDAGRVRADGHDTGNLAESLFEHQGLVYGRAGRSLVAYTARRSGHVAGVEVARILPLCTKIYRGCAISTGPSGTWVYLFSDAGVAVHRVSALDGRRVVDAAADRGIAQVVTADARGLRAHIVCEAGVHSEPTTRTDAFVATLADVALLGHDAGLRVVARRSPLTAGRVVNATLGARPFVLRGRPAAVEGHEICTYALTR